MIAPIIIRSKENSSNRTLQIVSSQGDLQATFYPEQGLFHLTNFNVGEIHRRKGVGKAMLRIAEAEARTLGATHIGATILSHACLDSMRTIFGDSSIDALRITDYDDLMAGRDDETRAALIHEIDGDTISGEQRQLLLEEMLYFGMRKPYPATIGLR